MRLVRGGGHTFFCLPARLRTWMLLGMYHSEARSERSFGASRAQLAAWPPRIGTLSGYLGMVPHLATSLLLGACGVALPGRAYSTDRTTVGGRVFAHRHTTVQRVVLGRILLWCGCHMAQSMSVRSTTERSRVRCRDACLGQRQRLMSSRSSWTLGIALSRVL